MNWKPIHDRCPICGAFWDYTYRKVWGEIRIDCNKCGFGMRGDMSVQTKRYNNILKCKTKEEKLEYARIT